MTRGCAIRVWIAELVNHIRLLRHLFQGCMCLFNFPLLRSAPNIAVLAVGLLVTYLLHYNLWHILHPPSGAMSPQMVDVKCNLKPCLALIIPEKILYRWNSFFLMPGLSCQELNTQTRLRAKAIFPVQPHSIIARTQSLIFKFLLFFWSKFLVFR